MTNEAWTAALTGVPFETDAEGWGALHADRFLTLYVAHDGVPLMIQKVEAWKTDGSVIRARTRKGETYVLMLQDVYAFATELPSAPDRKAGFSAGR